MNMLIPKQGRGGKKRPAKRFESLHMGEVAKQHCIVCGGYPCDVHHCYCDRDTRYGGKRAPHLDTIPLCDFHHQAKFCEGGLPIHGRKKTWVAKFGKDWKYIPETRLIIYGDALITDQEIEKYWEGFAMTFERIDQ